MKRVLSLVLIFILVFAVASCGDKKKKKDDVKEKVSKEISAEEGGTVSTSDESVAVDIPADALDSNTTITVSVYESSHYSTAKGEKVISTVVEFEPSGTVFKKPIIIKMTANNEIKDKVVAAAVYNEAKGAWSYSEHSEYAILVGKDAAGDPIMQTAAGDPIMLNAAGDPIMMNAAGDPIMLASAGDPIMLASAGDPIMSNAAGDPIMNAAAGDPIMMTTGHFTAYTFIVVEESDSQAGTGDADADTNDGDEDVSPDEDNAPECGNGVVEEGEECDRGEENGKTDCVYGEKSCEVCTKECKKQAGAAAYCGDGTKQSNEACDKADPEYGKGEGIGASCSDDCQIVTRSCGTLPENAQWVNGDTYESTRNGEEYSSASAHYAEEGDCAYKCKPTFSWIDSSCKCTDEQHLEDGVCKSNTQTAASCGTLPANAAWVNGDTYIPTWNGSAYSSATANYAESGDCAYKCKSTYSWIDSSCKCQSTEHVEDGVCKSNTQAAASCGTLPANAAWVNGDTYIPTWNGNAYSSASANYAGEGDCAFTCKQTFTWFATNGTCACTDEEHVEDNVCTPNTGTAKTCANLPANAAWKASTYTPHWSNGAWSTEPAATYFEDEGEECTYECVANYHYENESCQSDTKEPASCGELPENAAWVNGDTYVPTWYGEGYTYASANYAGEGDCAFTCKQTFTWFATNGTCACTDEEHVEDSVCTPNTGTAKNCANLPANAAWKVSTYTPHWSNGAWSTEPAATYFEDEGEECTYECVANYHYENESCQSNTKPAESCGTLPANAQWVNGNTYIPEWTGEDYSSASANYAEEGDCAYQCKPTFTWFATNGTCACTDAQHVEDSVCKSNTGEEQECANLPDNAEWVASTYTPHWIDEAWSTEPAATYFEDEGEECTYECSTDYHYEEESCQSDTKPAESCGELPENAAWVNGDTYIPTWNGKGYPYYTAHYAEEGDCAYQCVEGYEWNENTVKCSVPVAKVLCTGQTWCFGAEGDVIDCPAEGEEFYGQDASYTARQSCTPQTYEKISEGRNCIQDNDTCNIVDDLSTGLRWYLYSNGGTWENAYTFCDTLDTGDGREWRLPTAKELMSIIDSGTSYPALRMAYFGWDFASPTIYWSGTYYQNQKTGDDAVLVMDIGYGHMQYESKEDGSASFACVSGEEYGVSGTFTLKNISGGTVVTDSATDLMWKAAADNLNMSWSQALAYCENLEYAGYSDWRLPNRNEFATVLNYTGKGFGDNKSDFQNIIGGNYWTSTFAQTYGGSEGPFIIDVGGGTLFSVGDTQGNVTTAYTLCVRNDDLAEYQAVPVCDESGYTPCEDPETGIVWSQNINTGSYDPDYVMAAGMCRESNNGGISQWRLPTISEIRTILKSDALTTGGDCDVADTCNAGACYVDEECRTGAPIESIFYNDTYMVSSTMIDDENHAWGVDFFTGSIVSYARNDDLYPMITVRCVKDESLPDITFPYTDPENELIWSSRSKGDMTWMEAAEYCRDLVEGNSDNWRVPALEEVETLVKSCDGDDCEPNLTGNYSVFAELAALWSSTISVETALSLNVLDFMTGYQEGITENINSYSDAKVRCVRSTDDPETDPIIDAPYYDEDSNLLWSEKSGPLTNHSDAVAYCESLNAMNNGAGYEGLTEWRVPDLAEFASILDCEEGRSTFIRPTNNNQGNPGVSVALGGCDNPAFEGHFPVFGDLGIFASTYLGRTGYHFYADFTTGQVLVAGYEDGSFYGDRKKYVRCVSYPNACEDNPCLEIENSDGTCTSEAGVYSCGCTANALWDGEECVIQE